METMTGIGKQNQDIKTKQKRNKTVNADGEKYDKRKGRWKEIELAIILEGEMLYGWLTKERVDAELKLLNYPGKEGPQFRYPPSLICFLMETMNDDWRSYRREISRIRPQLRLMGFESAPHFTTLHKNIARFFAPDTRDESGLTFGQRIMDAATPLLKEAGVEEILDPVELLPIGTGQRGEYEAPQLKVTSEAEEAEQALKDEEAEEISVSMEVVVFSRNLEASEPMVCALDGSGQGIAGPGVYFEHIWNSNNRRFIKHHAMIDVNTLDVVAMAVTLESPSDPRMFEPILRGAMGAGAPIARVYADSAYDTKTNWKVADEEGVEFCPNLKKNFGKDRDLPERNEQLERQEEIGRKELHMENGYNDRWHVEAFFSVFKRLYGERIRSRKFMRMSLEMGVKYAGYNLHQRCLREAAILVGV